MFAECQCTEDTFYIDDDFAISDNMISMVQYVIWGRLND